MGQNPTVTGKVGGSARSQGYQALVDIGASRKGGGASSPGRLGTTLKNARHNFLFHWGGGVQVLSDFTLMEVERL